MNNLPVKNFNSFRSIPTSSRLKSIASEQNAGKGELVHAEFASTILLAVDSQLFAQLYALLKAAFFLEIDTLKALKLLADSKNELAVLEPTDSQRCGEVGEPESLCLSGSL